MSDSDNTKNTNNKNDRGGKRPGSGRPVGSGKYKEPTKAIRVPEGSVSYIKEYLTNEYAKPTKQKVSDTNVIMLGKSVEQTPSLRRLY